MRLRLVQGLRDDRSIAGRVVTVLAERIVTGALKPGMPVRQDHVALEFGASHVPVREAFRVLEGQGLLVSAPRRGVRVAPLDPAGIREVTEMRAALEVLALRHALPRIDAGALDAAARALAEGEASTDIRVWESANRRFHDALTQACAMPRLIAALDDLRRAGTRYLFAAWVDLGWQPRSDREHHEILARAVARDADGACDALARHIRAAGEALILRVSRGG